MKVCYVHLGSYLGGLGYVDGDVAVVVAEPGEGGAKEEVGVAHEVHLDPLC